MQFSLPLSLDYLNCVDINLYYFIIKICMCRSKKYQGGCFSTYLVTRWFKTGAFIPMTIYASGVVCLKKNVQGAFL